MLQPISYNVDSYQKVYPLFLLGAEILACLSENNPKIIGLVIDTTEFKLTQFVDDTTLILNVSQNSLQAALNVLEIFGSISSLKMKRQNKDDLDRCQKFL